MSADMMLTVAGALSELNLSGVGHCNWIFTGWSRQCGLAEKDKLPYCGLKYAFKLQ